MDLLDKEIKKLNTLTKTFSLNEAFNESVMKAISDYESKTDLNTFQEKEQVSKGKILHFLMELGKSERLFDGSDLSVKEEFARIFHILGINIPIKELKEALLEIKEGYFEEIELSDESLEAVVGGVVKFGDTDLLKIRDRAIEVLESSG